MSIITGAFQFLAQNPQILIHTGLYQLLLSAVSVGVAIVISVPTGMITGHLHKGAFLAISGGNVARALPTLAIIAVGITLWGIGFLNIMIALVILAIPPILTNTYVAVSTVDPAMVEAARGMGMRPWEVLTRVELPSSVALILGGIRTGAVFVIATAYLASFAGNDGTLGLFITNEGHYGLPGVLAATIVAVALAFAVEGLLALCQRLLTPHGIRLLRAGAVAASAAA